MVHKLTFSSSNLDDSNVFMSSPVEDDKILTGVGLAVMANTNNCIY